jgi:hypothetical protein
VKLHLLLLGVCAAVADRAEAALDDGGAADIPAAPAVAHERHVVQLAVAQEGQGTWDTHGGSTTGALGTSQVDA